MKKLMVLIALVFTTLGYSQAEYEKIAITANGVSSSTSKINTQETNGEINYINATSLPVSTATTNALELETDVSAGAITGFALTNNGNGTVNIASGTAFLRTTNDPYAQIIKYPISAVTNLALTDNANNFVLVDYNSGSPTLTVTTNSSTINTQTNSLCYVISRVGNTLDHLSLVGQNVDPNAKLRVRFLNQEGIRRASGAVLGFSSRNLTLTSSVLFSGLIRINAVAFNTASPDTFTLAYNNGSAWTRTTGQTQVNNTQYNVSGTLTTMPNNTFRTDYVYLLPNNPSKLYVIMGTTTYGSLTLAKAAPRPSALPVELQVLGLEVGRLFIEKNNAAIAEVQSSFANDFIGASVPEHNALTGLQGGTAGEYNHLTNAQVSLVDGSEQAANKATDFTTVNNTLYPSVQAVKTELDLKANDLYVIHTTGNEVASGVKTFSDGVISPVFLSGTYAVDGDFSYIDEDKIQIQKAPLDLLELSSDLIKLNSPNGRINVGAGAGGYGKISVNGAYTEMNSHGFDDYSTLTPAVGGSGYGVFDASTALNGSVNNDHFIAYQARLNYNSSGNLGSSGTPISQNPYMAGFYYSPVHNGTGTIFQNVGTVLYDISGTGPVERSYGMYISNINRGSLSNYSIFTNQGEAHIGDVLSVDGEIVSNNVINAKLGVNMISSTSSAGGLSFEVNGTVKNYIGNDTNITGSNINDFTIYNTVGGFNLYTNGVKSFYVSSSGDATLTGTPTAPTAAAGTNTTQIATTAFVQTATGNYKKYVALISQSGTSAPTATVLENTLGGSVTFNYVGVGDFTMTSSALFTANKTASIAASVDRFVAGVNWIDSSTIQLRTSNAGVMANGYLTNTMVEIRVYP